MDDIGQIVKKGRGVNLVYKSYRHKKDRSTSTTQYWRCVISGCSGRVHSTIVEDGEVRISNFTDHSHIPDELGNAAVIAKSDLCKKAEEDTITPLNQLYRDFISNNDQNDYVPGFKGVQSQMHRKRREMIPPLPDSIPDISIDGSHATLPDGRNFILHQDDNMIILGTEDNLKILSASTQIFMDGTFKASPKLFKQLYSIHGLCSGHVVPLVYALLPDKTKETYYKMFDHIKQKMAVMGLVFNPEIIMTDFESALISTVALHFPNSKHKGCYFHHTQAVWRQVQNLGLVTLYKENPDMKKIIRMLMALAFLPVITVRSSFMMLKDKSIVKDSDLLKQLFAYFEETWLKVFPIAMWNVYCQETRTNNTQEGWHHRLNRSVKKMHPNVFELLHVLKKEQAVTENTIFRAQLGEAPDARKKKYRKLNQKIEQLNAQFKAGQLNSEDFLCHLRHSVHEY